MWCITTNNISAARFFINDSVTKVNFPAPITTNVRTKFHEDWSINVTSRVFKRFYYSHTYFLTKFQEDLTINVNFISNTTSDIIGKTCLTRFHDNQAINVTYRVLTRKTVDDALRTKCDPKSTP
ncbi:hypothetical protein DPMN_112366 [Dreissena polymorpha]|uniref:Uncharacterized protein n=1 Tax=Dreissena polymorpha TaxID=45954 RepID=A0A9D4QPY0_DREPO|nr:hypothetical protein DPMN_112366 [Dreissena polymorpha]